jgi:hypothetical protein
LFSKRVFQSVQVLLTGAILAAGKCMVTAVLRVMELDQQPHFQTYHSGMPVVPLRWVLIRDPLGQFDT